MRRSLALSLAAAGLLLTGCVDIEQTLTLDKNLGGKAGLSCAIDFDPMVRILATMMRTFASKEGPPTAEDMAAAREEFLKDRKEGKEGTPDPEKLRADLSKNLPPGVTLLDSSVEDQGLRFKLRFLFGFDDAAKLAQIKLSKGNAEATPTPMAKGMTDSPFENLLVKDEGKTILVTSKPVNPLDGPDGESGEDDDDLSELDAETREEFQDFRIAIRIEAPFKIVEHNATRVEGKTLVWEFKLADLERIEKEARAQGRKGDSELPVRVRFQK